MVESKKEKLKQTQVRSRWLGIGPSTGSKGHGLNLLEQDS